LAKILNEAVSKRTPAGTVLPLLNVTVDPGSQSVVVTGSPGDVQHAATILSQLDASIAPSDDRQTRMIDLGSAAAVQRLGPLVEQLYRSQVGDSPALAQGKILPDAESGRLIVTASKEHLDKIEAIVTQLRNKETQPQDRRLEIIPLRNVTVDAALKSITDLVAERMNERRFQNAPKPLLLPDATNNRLLVTANEAQLKEIGQVLQAIDVAPESGRRTMTMLPLQSVARADRSDTG
jgi:type II secretory pathway component GspD/PulD (secretin)